MTTTRKGIKRITIRTWVVIIILIIAAFAMGKYVIAGPNGRAAIPGDFLKARSNGAELSASIVGIYDSSVERLKTIAEKDKEQKYYEALNLTLEGKKANQEAVEKSQQLATELGRMAEISAQFNSREANNLVVEAITAEINLVTHLITYNGYSNELLGNLQGKFSGTESSDRVGELIDKMNSEATTINRLNKKFNELMAEFDTKYK